MTSDSEMHSIHPRESLPEEHDAEKVKAVENAFTDLQEPFSSGTCAVPPHQLLLYYSQDDIHRRVNFADVKPDDLHLLYQACKPAEFGRDAETILDETYRKAGKMDLSSFATLFDPRSLGIHEQIVEGLLIGKPGLDYGVILELYKLNVYEKGDFFKIHKDTPRSERMLGSLVVVLPTKHEGGQLVLHQGDKQFNIDFTKELAEAKEPSVCFVAFFGDVEHEVLPVTSGHRVTLTYNIYHNNAPKESLLRIQSPFHQSLKKALVELVNDQATLPRGGYLGFGLIQEYVLGRKGSVEPIWRSLKGSDSALANICDELGLPYSVKLLYSKPCGLDLDMITDRKLDLGIWGYNCNLDEPIMSLLECALLGVPKLTINEAEGVHVIGRKQESDDEESREARELLAEFYRDPVTQILEVRHMSAMQTESPFTATYGNEALQLDYVYGKACLLVRVDPLETRQRLVA